MAWPAGAGISAATTLVNATARFAARFILHSPDEYQRLWIASARAIADRRAPTMHITAASADLFLGFAQDKKTAASMRREENQRTVGMSVAALEDNSPGSEHLLH